MPQVWMKVAPRLWTARSGEFVVHSGVIIDSGEACLVDPGLLPQEIDAILRRVTDCGAALRTIILTHCHWDHVLGPESLPKTQIVAHAEYATQSTGRQGRRVVRQVEMWEADLGKKREQPFSLPCADRTFTEQLTLFVGETPWQLIHAPGHAPDHLVAYEPKSGTLWAADMLSESEIPYVCHSLVAYRETLDRLFALETRFLVPAHGSETSDARTIRARFDHDTAYLGELYDRVEYAIREGRTLDETVLSCDEMLRSLPGENERPHRMNVESAFIELGGESVTANCGWRGLVDDVD